MRRSCRFLRINKLDKRVTKELLFFYWESPSPSYEEAIEIKRLKGAGFLRDRGERRNH
jgi:hypothetical protein